jgi:threonine/homoserine/homoserine lactone efflux protein
MSAMRDVLELALGGLLLGLNGGFAPGPLTALVISEGISHGRRAGWLAGLAPLVTDAPLVIVSLLLVSVLPGGDVTLAVIAAAGALLLVYLGVKGLRSKAEDYAVREGNPGGSLVRAVGVNLLNPNPYLFWFTVCAPRMVEAYRGHGLAAPVAFLIAFYVALVGTKSSIGLVAGSVAHRLKSRTLLWINRVLSVCLLGYAGWLGWQAWARLSAGG